MVPEPVAGALEVDHVGVMDDAVDHRGGGGEVALHLAPAGEGLAEAGGVPVRNPFTMMEDADLSGRVESPGSPTTGLWADLRW